MDWIIQVGSSIIISVITSLLSYLSAVKKSKNEIEAIKISADNEIQKIKEESNKELNRIQKQTDEQIRLKIAENDLSSKSNEEQIKFAFLKEFVEEFLKDPENAMKKAERMKKWGENFSIVKK